MHARGDRRLIRSALTRVSLLSLCLALLPFLPARAARADGPGLDAKLARQIRARLKKAGVRKGKFGISVFERGRVPKVVYSEGHLIPLIPASTAKLLTAMAALDILGPSHRFETLASALGPIEGGVLKGDLVVHGTGDPGVQATYLGKSDTAYGVVKLVADLRAAGVRRITGDVILDEGPLDRVFTHPTWTKEDKRSAYGAGVGGLNLHEGCLQVRVTGAPAAGRAPVIHFPTTAGPYRYKNDAKTVTGKRVAIGAAFSGTTPVLRIWGQASVGKAGGMNVPVPDPVLFFGGALVQVLRRQGILVDGAIRRARDALEVAGGTVIAQHVVPIAPVLKVMNVHSRNVVASTVFKLIGAHDGGGGTWAGGETAIRNVAKRRSMADGVTRIVDGSGLSLQNRTTSALLVQMLAAFDRDVRRGPLLLGSLATSGVSGTLRRRLRSKALKGRVHAKTGTLNDVRVRALAGFIDGRRGHPGYVFAILLNGRGANSLVVDDIVRLIAKR